jgi:hypothetical protein
MLPIGLLLTANAGIVVFMSRANKIPNLKLRKSSRIELRKLSSQTQNLSVFQQNRYQQTSYGYAQPNQSKHAQTSLPQQQQQQQYKRKQLFLKTVSTPTAKEKTHHTHAIQKTPNNKKIPINRPPKPKFSFKMNSKFFNKNISLNTTEMIDKNSKKLSIMAILISTSFCFLNLPYLSVWAFFYKELAYNNNLDIATKYSFFSAVQIAEIFFLIYYNLNFFIYFVFKSLFKT